MAIRMHDALLEYVDLQTAYAPHASRWHRGTRPAAEEIDQVDSIRVRRREPGLWWAPHGAMQQGPEHLCVCPTELNASEYEEHSLPHSFFSARSGCTSSAQPRLVVVALPAQHLIAGNIPSPLMLTLLVILLLIIVLLNLLLIHCKLECAAHVPAPCERHVRAVEVRPRIAVVCGPQKSVAMLLGAFQISTVFSRSDILRLPHDGRADGLAHHRPDVTEHHESHGKLTRLQRLRRDPATTRSADGFRVRCRLQQRLVHICVAAGQSYCRKFSVADLVTRASCPGVVV
eukprot:7376216-Prymnesium_polylepis.1